MSKKVYVTGATGFVGKHVVAYLEAHTDWDIVTGGMPDFKCDYIINLASGSSVEKSIKEPVEFINNNISCMLKILEYARKYPPKVFLHFSSVEARHPYNPYAASKTAQEAIATAYSTTYGLPIIVVSSNNIVGEGQNSEKFIPKIIEQIKDGKTVNLYKQKGIFGSRTYNPIGNVVDALWFLLLRYDSIVNLYTKLIIDGGENLTNLEMAELVARNLSKPLKYVEVEANNVRPGYTQYLGDSGFDGVNLMALDWHPPQTLEEGMAWVK